MTKRRLRSLLIFCFLVVILLGGGIYLRNFFLSQIRNRIQSVLRYNRVHLKVIPPLLVLEEVETISRSPFFSAKRVSLGLPFASLLKSEKPLTVLVEQPVVSVSTIPSGKAKERKPPFSVKLPFAIEKALIRGAEFHYRGKNTQFHATGIKALLQQKGETLSLKGKVEGSFLALSPERKPLEGKMNFLVEISGNRLRVRKFTLSGPEVTVKAAGNLINLRDPQGQLRVFFRAGMKALAGILNIPFRWEGRTGGEGELIRSQKEIRYRTSFTSDDLVLNEVSLDNVRGQVEYVPNRGYTIAMDIRRKSGALENVRISSRGGKTFGELNGFHLDPILSFASLPWPVRSPVWGGFTVDDRQFVADFEFKDDVLSAEAGKYPFNGRARFLWDKHKDIAFALPSLVTSFGRLDVEGELFVGRDLDVTIRGDLGDVKSAREFTSLVLRRELHIPEIRGQGHVDAKIKGAYSSPQVKMDFLLSPAGFAKFEMSSAKGSVELTGKTVFGRFEFDDPEARGEVSLLSGKDELDVEIRLADGVVEKILPNLNINIPLRGRAAGVFQVSQRGQALHVDGLFSSSQFKFGPVEGQAVTGKLSWGEGILTFPELAFDFYGGRIKSSSWLDLKTDLLEIDLAAEQIDLAAVNTRLGGKLSANFKGEGVLGGDIASGAFEVKKFSYGLLQPTDAGGELKLGILKNALSVKAKGNFFPGENDFSVDSLIPLSKDGLFFDLKGSFSNLDLLMPWKGIKGKINYLAEIRSSKASPRLDGVIDFQGPLLPIPRFAHALTDYSGLVFIQNNKASIRSFKAKLGGGEVQGAGEMTLGKGGFETIMFSLEGKNLLLSPIERTRALTDASVKLIKENGRFVLEGNIDVQRLSWRREILEKLAFSSSPYPSGGREPGFLDDLTLNLRLKADDNAWMENSLGRMRGRFDLSISGSVKAPILLGDIESLGGEAYFQDRRFQILRGRVSFFNPSAIEPYLDFMAETYVKDYRVTITLTGLANQLRPEFSSSPPLPPEDVLALLTLGEAFKRPLSTETSSQISTASLLSFQLTEEAAKRAGKLFSLDRFRIDPFLMGSSAEMTARLTVGKKISRDFFIYYSTNLTRQTEEIIRLEWDLSNGFSLVGTRNELGRLSFDVKIRRRF